MISTDAQRRLARITEIQIEISRLEGELEGLLGGGPKPLTVRDREKPNGGKGRPTSQRRCGHCSEIGHQARKCPRLGREEKRSTPGKPLTEGQFAEVKQGRKDELTSLDMANEMGVDIGEVNAALTSPNYKYYMSNRA